jgi:predicted permease
MWIQSLRCAPNELMEAFFYDLKYAIRALARSPGFTALTALTMSLGIGATSVVFSLVDPVLLRPPARVHDPSRLVRINVEQTFPGLGRVTRPFSSYPEYQDFATRVKAFEGVAAFTQSEPATLRTEAGTEHVKRVLATASFFPVLGVQPTLGRFFAVDEDQPPLGSPVAVLSYGLWRRRFGGDSGVLGKQLDLDGRAYAVVGVAPAGFTGLSLDAADVWVPATTIGSGWYRDRHSYPFMIAARLRTDARVEQAASEATAARQPADPDDRGTVVALGSILLAHVPDGPPGVKLSILLGGVSLFLLLLACLNAASLLLARALDRRRDIAVRLALGGGRTRIARQIIAESLVLAGLGGAAAILLAQWGGDFLRTVIFPSYNWASSAIDGRVVGFTALAVLGSGILAGLVPAMQTSRSAFTRDLREGWRDTSVHRSRVRFGLLVTQVALSLMLIAGAGLFVRSLVTALSFDLGFDAQRLVIVEPTFDTTRRAVSPASYEEIRERLASIPGVERVSLSLTRPFGFSVIEQLTIPGLDSFPTTPSGGPFLNEVSPNFFATTGTKILRGRAFSNTDSAEGSRVVVVSATMARLLWPGEDAVGKCLKEGTAASPCSQIVGIAQDATVRDLGEEPAMQLYTFPRVWRDLRDDRRSVLIRTSGASRQMVSEITSALRGTASGADMTVSTFRELTDPLTRPWRLGATLLGLCAGLALALAALGLYATLAHAVSQRTHEIGIRIALGARTGHVVRMAVALGVRASLVGSVLGIAGALLGGRAVASQLFRVSPSDPVVLGLAVLTLLLVAVIASYIPARRATRVDPVVALRAE